MLNLIFLLYFPNLEYKYIFLFNSSSGSTSTRASIPPISPQEQGRVQSLQGGLTVPNFETSLVSIYYFSLSKLLILIFSRIKFL